MLYVMICLKYLLYCLIVILKQELITFAEMGARAREQSGPKIGGVLCPFLCRGAGLHLTQCHLG